MGHFGRFTLKRSIVSGTETIASPEIIAHPTPKLLPHRSDTIGISGKQKNSEIDDFFDVRTYFFVTMSDWRKSAGWVDEMSKKLRFFEIRDFLNLLPSGD